MGSQVGTQIGTATERGGAAVTDRGEETRRHILETAAQAFAARGYAGTSLNELVRATGLSKGAFYFHFPSKESLALAVVRTKQEQWAGRVMSEAMRHRRAIDQLLAIPRTMCDLYEQDPGSRSLGKLCGELARQPQLAPEVRPQLLTWIDLTSSIVRRAQDEGDIDRAIDPNAAAEAAVSAFIGIDEVSSVLDDGGEGLRPRVERFLALFLDGLRPRAKA